MSESKVKWARINNEPFEYAVQQGPHGDEFVKLLDGSCLHRPAEEKAKQLWPPLPLAGPAATSEETDLVSGYVYRESYRLGTEWRRRAEEAEAKLAWEPVDITGWKLVPDVPTEEMWQAGRSADIHPGDSYTKVWSAMFEAAPDVDDCETTVSRPQRGEPNNG